MKIVITDMPDGEDIIIENVGKFVLLTSELDGIIFRVCANLEFLSFASKRLNYEVDRKLFIDDIRNKKED